MRPQPVVVRSAVTPRDLTAPELIGFAALALNLTISANVLILAGIPYDSPGGNPMEKLHPGTYCAALALTLLAWRHGVTGLLRAALRQAPSICVFLGMMLLCTVFQAATGGSDRLVIYLESFFPAGALALVFVLATPRARRVLGWALLVLLLVNVLIAWAETVQDRQWIPVFLVDRELVLRSSDFRPTALYDHPLSGAMLSMIGLFLACAPAIAKWQRGTMIVAFVLGLLAFGGRAAIVVSGGMLAVQGGAAALRRMASGRMRLRDVAIPAAGLVIAGASLAVLLIASPAGARIAARFTWDASAAARGVQWQILGMLDTGEWLFGTSRARVELMVANLGLRYAFVAVENFWLLMFLNLGLFGFPIFLLGFLSLLAGMFRRAGWHGRVLLVAVMVVASTSNSLGRKSNILTVLIPAVLATTGFATARTAGEPAHAG